jgi:hypothetical protein
MGSRWAFDSYINQRHLKTCAKVILLFRLSVLNKVALNHLNFGLVNYSKSLVVLFLADNKQPNRVQKISNMGHYLTEMVNNRSWNNFFHTRFNKSLRKKEHRSGCQ